MGAILSKVLSYFTVPSTHLLTYPQDTKEIIRNPKSIALSESMKGKSIHVKNVELMFEGWPMGEVNPIYSKLKPVVEAKIDRCVPLNFPNMHLPTGVTKSLPCNTN